MIHWKALTTSISAVLALTAAAGCSNGGKTSTAPVVIADDQTPVTLTIAGRDDQATFDQKGGSLLKKKYPYITIKYVQYDTSSTSGAALKDMVAKGDLPDIIEATAINDIQSSWNQLGLKFDLTPLLQKYKFDVNAFDPSFMQNIRQASGDGIAALPYYEFENVLYYNKDIFDKFAVNYPKDGMTWQQIYELAKQVTRKEGNTAYRGLEPDDVTRLARQYPLQTLDPKTDQAQVTNSGWTQLLTFVQQVYSIPGNLPDDPKLIGKGTNPFLVDQNLAMWPYGTDHWDQIDVAVKKGLKWDMVTYPTFADAPNQGPSAAGTILAITPTSKYKDQAFKLITYMDSTEVQTYLSREGYAPAVTTSEVRKVYGADVAVLNGKNSGALFGEKLAVLPKDVSLNDSLGNGPVRTAVTDVATGKKDVNTALHDAANALNQSVASLKQQK
ncbi:MAG: family 1 extracellular solute-binding protein [Bacilli bacterium]|nr:family 1 extracellular solute-binding protein [Bacilli bacterium]